MDNVVTLFMYYMYNKWSKEESIRLFGNDLGNHIFNKWLGKHEYSNDITMSWYADLDNERRQMIVDRAIEVYSKK